MASRTIIVLSGQCLEDIALQEYGHMDGVRNLLFDNGDVLVDGFSTRLWAGMELVIGSAPIDVETFNAMRKLGVTPATDDAYVTPPIGPGGDYLPADYNTDHFVTAP